MRVDTVRGESFRNISPRSPPRSIQRPALVAEHHQTTMAPSKTDNSDIAASMSISFLEGNTASEIFSTVSGQALRGMAAGWMTYRSGKRLTTETAEVLAGSLAAMSLGDGRWNGYHEHDAITCIELLQRFFIEANNQMPGNLPTDTSAVVQSAIAILDAMGRSDNSSFDAPAKFKTGTYKRF